MLLKSIQKGVIKEVFFSCVILSTYLFHGITRSYPSFLFYQLDSPSSSITVNDEQKSWVAACINLLSPLGCIFGGILMDTYGRKICIQGVFVPFLISWLTTAFAKNVSMLYIAALIHSIGTGMSFSTSTYVSEIATAGHRGALLGIVEVIFHIGVFMCNFLMYYIKWSIVAFILSVISAISLLLTFSLPESPTWLYLKGRKEESINTLTSIRCQDRDVIKSEIDDMETYTSSQVKTKFSETVKDCLASWRQFCIAFVLFLLTQGTGYSVMTLFLIMIVDRLNIPYPSTDIALLYSAACSVAGFITPYAMYKFNRKPTLAVSALGMSLSAAAIPIYKLIFEEYDEKPFSWIIPFALSMYVIWSSFGVLPVGFTIAGELFPNKVRGIMNGIYGAVAYIYWSFLYKITPWYLSKFGASGVMWTFSGFALLTALYSIFVLPETKGKTLNEVQEKYFKKKR
ncbi:facilitated trehalose transporter Tret1-like [Planococcus citri]|uniref:facilitated trehalose transporter Tret1-like n=1 Tax=Planococcus citri TaxID=170843 RepID=UPI0031F92A03